MGGLTISFAGELPQQQSERAALRERKIEERSRRRKTEDWIANLATSGSTKSSAAWHMDIGHVGFSDGYAAGMAAILLTHSATISPTTYRSLIDLARTLDRAST